MKQTKLKTSVSLPPSKDKRQKNILYWVKNGQNPTLVRIQSMPFGTEHTCMHGAKSSPLYKVVDLIRGLFNNHRHHRRRHCRHHHHHPKSSSFSSSSFPTPPPSLLML